MQGLLCTQQGGVNKTECVCHSQRQDARMKMYHEAMTLAFIPCKFVTNCLWLENFEECPIKGVDNRINATDSLDVYQMQRHMKTHLCLYFGSFVHHAQSVIFIRMGPNEMDAWDGTKGSRRAV